MKAAGGSGSPSLANEFTSWFDPRYLQPTKRLLDAFEPDIVLTNGIYYNVSPSVLVAASDVPVVFVPPDPTGLAFPRLTPRTAYKLLLYPKVLTHRTLLATFVDAFIAQSVTIVDHLNEVLGNVEQPVYFLPHPSFWEPIDESGLEYPSAGPDTLFYVGRLAAEEGMQLCYHHHMGTGCQTMAEVDRLLENTDPDKVWLLYDTGHFVFSSEDPLAAVKRYVSRIGHVHLKDVRPDVFKTVQKNDDSFLDAVRAGVFTVPGDGSIAFPEIFKVLEEADYRGWIVVEAEQDPAEANPLEYAMKARSYIREHTGL